MTQLTWTVLGCGSSGGAPAIGCSCPTCTSTDPRNTRTRCSAYVRIGDTGVLIDTGPALRQQALRDGITRVDAVLYTPPHAVRAGRRYRYADSATARPQLAVPGLAHRQHRVADRPVHHPRQQPAAAARPGHAVSGLPAAGTLSVAPARGRRA